MSVTETMQFSKFNEAAGSVERIRQKHYAKYYNFEMRIDT